MPRSLVTVVVRIGAGESVSACVHTCADARVQERGPGALEQELKETASCPTSLLGARLGFPGRAASALSCGVVSLAPRDTSSGDHVQVLIWPCKYVSG